MRKIIILFILLIPLVGCRSESEKMWKEIVNQEYTADNGWAGVGMFFFEDKGQKYCDYLIYGSGVRVAGQIRLEVNFNEDGDMVLSMPYGVYNNDLDSESTEVVEVIVEYEDGKIIWNDQVFEDKDSNQHSSFHD